MASKLPDNEIRDNTKSLESGTPLNNKYRHLLIIQRELKKSTPNFTKNELPKSVRSARIIIQLRIISAVPSVHSHTLSQ